MNFIDESTQQFDRLFQEALRPPVRVNERHQQLYAAGFKYALLEGPRLNFGGSGPKATWRSWWQLHAKKEKLNRWNLVALEFFQRGWVDGQIEEHVRRRKENREALLPYMP